MAGNQVGHRHEPDRDLARTLLQPRVEGEHLDYGFLGRKHGLAAVRATKDELVRGRTPLNQMEPKLDGSLSRRPKDHLTTIGCAMRPDLSGDQAQAWVMAELVKLSNFPPHVLAKATERALHLTFQFPSEVEGKVRELADEHMERIAAAIMRVESIERALNEALNPQPQLTDEKAGKPLTTEEVHDLQRKGGVCKAVISLGLAKGYIAKDQLLPPDDPTLPQEEPKHV